MTPELTAALERAIKEAWPNWPEQFSLINGYEENQVACWKDDYGEWIRIIDVRDIDLFIIAATAEAHWRRRLENATGVDGYGKQVTLWATVGRLIEKEGKL